MLSVDSLHELNMFWRELFKPDLDKSLSSTKHVVGDELFRDNVTDRMKSLEDASRSVNQLKCERSFRGGKSNTEFKKPFLGNPFLGRSARRGFGARARFDQAPGYTSRPVRRQIGRGRGGSSRPYKR